MGLSNPIHIAFVLVLLLLVFGAKRLPEIGRSLGSGMRGFKDSISGESTEQVLRPAQPESVPAERPPVLAPVGAPTGEPRVPAA
jgi:sec-independent protein translocase protein TatA